MSQKTFQWLRMPWPPLPDALASLQHVHRVLLMDVTQDISVATTQEPTML